MPPHVLIVDDDQGIRETVRLVLEDAGHIVVEAADGDKALKLLRESAEGMVVLLDLIMPGTNGEELLALVAGDCTLSARHAYILMTAAQRQLTPAVEALAASISAPILHKPFDIDALLDSVSAAVQRLSSG